METTPDDFTNGPFFPKRPRLEMTPLGTPELILLLVALGGMTAAATWGVNLFCCS